MRNLHKLYYKDYYKHSVEIEEKDRTIGGKKIVKMNIVETKTKEAKIDYRFLLEDDKDKQKEIQKQNKEILNHQDGVNQLLVKDEYTVENLPNLPKIPNEACNPKYSISLETLYPGLITGVGLDHEAGVDGEFKLGMHFDYTHGMPIIYGSSVKGVLKTYFKDFAEKYYKDLAKETGKDIFEKFEKNIFEGIDIEKKEFKSIYERDIFFDAVITKPNKLGKILDSDTLCPHDKDPLKNPTPISFLKIASGVTIEFRFKLFDSKIGNITMTADNKKKIFEEILTTVGIGAKTNVGYGQLKK